jgi:uroporphyrinogen decarboxylase
MNSRDRVLTTLRHEEPDRVPIDVGGTPSSGISAKAYRRLKLHLGYDQNTRIVDLMQWLAEIEPNVRQILGGDVVPLRMRRSFFGMPMVNWKIWKSPDGRTYEVPGDFNPILATDGRLELWSSNNPQRVLGRMPSEGIYFEPVEMPLAMADTMADINSYSFPFLDEEDLEWLSMKAQSLFRETECAIVGQFGGSLLGRGQLTFGFSNFMEKLALNSELVMHWLERQTEAYLEMLSQYLPVVNKHIDVIMFGDDFGTQQNLQISPEMYRTIFKPLQEKMFTYVKQNSSLYILLHSDGAIRPIIPDLIEIGLDVLNPVQISAAGMNPTELKEEFGKHLVFWGAGVDTQRVLPVANIHDLREHIIDLIDVFSRGGGYVFAPVHNILEDIQPDRILLIYQIPQAYLYHSTRYS